MSDWKRAINMLRHACKRAGLPVFWHKHSPKTYRVEQHAIMLVFCRRYCTSYTEFVELLPNTILPDLLGLKSVPDEGTLCKEEKRLRSYLAQASIQLVKAALPRHFVAGGDGTGLQTRKRSAYYIKRINSRKARGFARLELVVWKTFILAWELRLLHKDELAMLKSCWSQLPALPSVFVYDKKADCEAHHEWLEEQGVRSIAPTRKRCQRGRHRKRLRDHFPTGLYRKRNRNETVNAMLKHRYGDGLSAYSVRGRRSEITTKILAHNLWQRIAAMLHELFNMTANPKSLNIRGDTLLPGDGDGGEQRPDHDEVQPLPAERAAARDEVRQGRQDAHLRRVRRHQTSPIATQSAQTGADARGASRGPDGRDAVPVHVLPVRLLPREHQAEEVPVLRQGVNRRGQDDHEQQAAGYELGTARSV
jgi:hypothetical protein